MPAQRSHPARCPSPTTLRPTFPPRPTLPSPQPTPTPFPQAWVAKYPSLMDSAFVATVNGTIAANQPWINGPAKQLCAFLAEEEAP